MQKPQPNITKEQASCLLNALLRARMQTMQLHGLGHLSFGDRAEHLEQIRRAESVVHELTREIE